MKRIKLPISKSIAHRLLMRCAMRWLSFDIVPIDDSTPEDVVFMRNMLENFPQRPYPAFAAISTHNSGTVMRFLTAYVAQRNGPIIIMQGNERLNHRPISQLVDALRELGADIEYMDEEGCAPLKIKGKPLHRQKIVLNNPASSQFVSALMLIGMEVETNCKSPYIEMTRRVLEGYSTLELDWSAAAFWYEAVALYGEEVLLEGLSPDTLQGDKQVVDIFRQLGVETVYQDDGVLIRCNDTLPQSSPLVVDFTACPDLYPAVYATCFKLGIPMQFTGLESLRLKECDRIEAMRQLDFFVPESEEPLMSCDDHRIAMALITAGYKVDETNCINKSYPKFLEQWQHYL